MPYSGKVAINGINYHGSAQFQFSLKDANGTEHWRNGADANESILVFVVNGRYSVMLGGQGMKPLPPELFLQHQELYLAVRFDTGDGPHSLRPDQLITATPRALVADVAKVAEMAKVAKVAEKLSGDITSDMLSPEVLSKLDANQSAAPMGPITRDMLSAEVLADLNKSALAVGPISLSMLAPEVTAKLESNASRGISRPITLSMLDAEVTAKLDQNTTLADGSVTASKMASNTITTSQLNEQILKYLKPEITAQPQGKIVYADSNVSFSVTAAGKYLTYQWKKDGSTLAGETDATLTITDANATQNDGNYTVVVSNDFGSVESGLVTIQVSDALMNGLVGWWKFDETNGTIAYDSSDNGNDGNLNGGPTWTTGKIGGALNFDGVDDFVDMGNSQEFNLVNSVTISVWFISNKKDAVQWILGKNRDVTGGYHLALSSNNYFSGKVNATQGTSAVISAEPFQLNSEWIHAIFCYDDKSGGQLFRNGEIQGSNSQASGSIISGNITNLNVGRLAFQGLYRFKGLIDDVRIYNRALSSAEVQALYNLGQ